MDCEQLCNKTPSGFEDSDYIVWILVMRYVFGLFLSLIGIGIINDGDNGLQYLIAYTDQVLDLSPLH